MTHVFCSDFTYNVTNQVAISTEPHNFKITQADTRVSPSSLVKKTTAIKPNPRLKTWANYWMKTIATMMEEVKQTTEVMLTIYRKS